MSSAKVAIVCFLYGAWPENSSHLAGKYLRALYESLRRNTTTPCDFWVFTDAPNWDHVYRFLAYEEVHHSFLPAWWASLRWNLRKSYMYEVKDNGLNRYDWVVCLDLDMVITGNVDFLLEPRQGMITCRGAYVDDIGGSVVGFAPGWAKLPVLVAYLKYNKDMLESVTCGSERKFLRRVVSACIIPKPEYWQNVYPGYIVSFKVDGNLAGSRIVRFHGSPRVHEVSHLPWVEQNWRVSNGAH